MLSLQSQDMCATLLTSLLAFMQKYRLLLHESTLQGTFMSCLTYSLFYAEHSKEYILCIFLNTLC